MSDRAEGCGVSPEEAPTLMCELIDWLQLAQGEGQASYIMRGNRKYSLVYIILGLKQGWI